ncbi:MAG TPA: SIS domain-containing protein [Nitriliruptorales bacterium]
MPGLVEREAAEQPDRVGAVLGRQAEVAALADRLRGRFTNVLLVARGSSDNVARYAQYVLGARNGLRAALAAPSLTTRYGARLDLRDTLTIGISQSGTSPDVVGVVSEAARQGAPTVAITNAPGSALAAAAEHVVALEAGAEDAVAATKTYTCSLAAIALLSAALAGDAGAYGDLADVPDAMREVLAARLPSAALNRWVSARRGIVVGRGYEFATAHETALKLQELGGVIAQAHSAADVRHGPVGGLTGDVPVIVFAAPGALSDDLVQTCAALASRGPLTTIGALEAAHQHAGVAWRLPEVAEWVAPLVSVVAGQRLAIALAHTLGRDADQPPGLTKVTRTR